MPRSKSCVDLLLAFTAGFVDIVGAITIYDVFTAHMTGTTVRMGQHLLERNWQAVILAVSVVAAFLCGSILGRLLIEIGSRTALRRVASVNLVLEGALLALVVPIGNSALQRGHAGAESIAVICPLLATLAAAMGLQTATLTRVGPLTVHTTFITGMMNKFAQLVSRWMFLIYDIHLGDTALGGIWRRDRDKVSREARFIFAIWLVYFLGAICGTWFGTRSGLTALYVPCCILLICIAVDQWQPLSLQEEKEQAEQ